MLLSTFQTCPHPSPLPVIKRFFDFPSVIIPCVSSSLRNPSGQGLLGKQNSGIPEAPPPNKPTQTPNKGGWESAQHAAQTKRVVLMHWHTYSLMPPTPSFLPTPCIFLSHQFTPCFLPAPAPCFNHKSLWQPSKHISTQLLSPSNNMSEDAELFMSPVTKMAISIGFRGAVLRSLPMYLNNLLCSLPKLC